MENEILNISQSSIAQALAADYFCIYYVDTTNDRFIEYSSSKEYKKFGLPTTGDDFIGFSRHQFEELIHPEDRERFLDRFTKEKVVEALDRDSTFTMMFRMLFDDEPVHVHLKVTRMIEEERKHVVIGISSIDEQVKAREAYERAHHSSLTYSRIAQALAGDYFVIYIVDPKTDEFSEYHSGKGYGSSDAEKQGQDFFALIRKKMSERIYDDDRERFYNIFHKDKILSIIERDGHFTMKCRLLSENGPVWVSLKASLMEDESGSHLIIGANNIDAQMKREESYRKAMNEARDKAKSDFLTNMSHDIRTPMNAIVGYTNIARANIEEKQIVEDSLEKIGSSSHFLLSLINDVLDMTKIETGEMSLNVTDCDLNKICSRIDDIISMQAKAKGLNISFDRSLIKDYEVRADELRLEQILVNILTNAIKYTPEGQSVSFEAKQEDTDDPMKKKYTFIISDTGIGISEEYLPYIFESFTRQEKTTINAIQGAGLGLAITASIVRLMDGKIFVSSKVNEGSTFTVEVILPLKEKRTVNEEEETDLSLLQGKKVLVVEDNEINAQVAMMVLDSCGMLSARTENGQIALDLLKQGGHFDAVLMDLQMPVMNGFETSRAIRRMESPVKDVPIIAMSANSSQEDVKNCLAAGMNDHIGKPFDPKAMMEKLVRHIKGDR